jgi:hypothetical protein
MSGTSVSESIAGSGTGSIHTVCQMPVTDVYQMPLGRLTCFPRGCVPMSVGSQTATTRSCVPEGRNALVTSTVNRS